MSPTVKNANQMEFPDKFNQQTPDQLKERDVGSHQTDNYSQQLNKISTDLLVNPEETKILAPGL